MDGMPLYDRPVRPELPVDVEAAELDYVLKLTELDGESTRAEEDAAEELRLALIRIYNSNHIPEHHRIAEALEFRHSRDCEVVKQRAALERELAADPTNEYLLGARIEYYGGGDQEVELCDCGAIF